MRVLFVNFSFDRKFHAGVSALSAYMKKHGHETDLIIYDSSYNEEKFKARIQAFDPGLVAVTAMTFQWQPSLQLMPMIKNATEAPIIVGGYHPTLYPEECIAAEHVDYICRGEGEESLLDLVDALESGSDPRPIPGLWLKTGSNGSTEITKNELRILNPTLDDFPDWDRDIFDFKSILRERGTGTLAHTRYTMPIGAGRGCPDICTYCSNSAMLKLYRGKGRYVRKRSPQQIIDEMKVLLDHYPIKFFEFWDERIAIFPQWIFEFCELYKKEIGIPWSADMRVERATPDILSAMKDAGCYMVWFGVEAGNEEYRKQSLKRFMKTSDIVEAFNNCRDVGLETLSLNMVGMPHETPELAKETIELNRILAPDVLLFFTYQAFPGTELGNMAITEGMAPKDSAYWYERPDTMLQQDCFPKETMIPLWEEWSELRDDLEAARRSRGSIAFEIDTLD